MTVHNPVTVLQVDSSTNTPTPQKSISGAALVTNAEYDTNGDPVPNNLVINWTWNADSTPNTAIMTNGINTWTKTWAYSGGNPTTSPLWMKT